jgi:(S)-ureidoglycine aminohydrolase
MWLVKLPFRWAWLGPVSRLGNARSWASVATHSSIPTAAGQRGARGATFTLLTPENRYVSRLPNLPGAKLYKLVTPRLAPARFAQYLVVAPPQGVAWEVEPGYEHFLFGRSGSATVHAGRSATVHAGDRTHALDGGGFAYLPSAHRFHVQADGDAEVIWLKRPYEQWPGLAAPEPTFGLLADVEATQTAVPGLTRQELLDPADPSYDFNVSLMSFGPGVGLSQIEIHDEEHGLYMTSGHGDYHLDGGEYPVQADDFIYMAPYCPQGFRAGPDGASYLLYKDVYRDGF